MGARMEAVWRILGLVWLATIGGLVLIIAGLAGLLWMVVDVIWQLITGRDGPPGRSSAAMRFLKRLWGWGNGQLNYVLFGEGTFPLLP